MHTNIDAYELVVGLEVHIQLATKSKLFATDSTEYGSEPNTQVGVVSLAHPGTLPQLNKKAVEMAIQMGLACKSKIANYCIFDRKNYFYPDLPKGYQITQDQTPICRGGSVVAPLNKGKQVRVQINRIHLEEDAGKSMHDQHEELSLIDLNRAGVPLIELVTEPCIHAAEEAMAFLTEIRKMVRYLEICDGDMEKGSLRCDANISVRKRGDNTLGAKVEVKNMNSIRNVGRAIQREYERQTEILSSKGCIKSETRLFDAATRKTHSMRAKEELNDYRYFPEPDLSPFTISQEWLDRIRNEMQPTPAQMRDKLTSEYGLSKYDAEVLTSEKVLVLFFMAVCEHSVHYKQVANWIIGPVKSWMNDQKEAGSTTPITSKQLADLVNAVAENQVGLQVAQQKVFPLLVGSPHESVGEVLSKSGIRPIDQDELSDVILKVLKKYPEKVAAYKTGKKNLLGLFMGEIMKETKGTADPKQTKSLLDEWVEKMKIERDEK